MKLSKILKKNTKLSKFIVEQKDERKPCDLCGKPILSVETCSIRINTINAGRRYIGSGRKFVMNYKIKICNICFVKTMEKINKII